MAQEETYIAIRSERLSKPHDTRYIVINRETREVVDDGLGHGYRSPQAAHKSFAYKQKFKTNKLTVRQPTAKYSKITKADVLPLKFK